MVLQGMERYSASGRKGANKMFITLHHGDNLVSVQTSHIMYIVERGEHSQITFTNGDILAFKESRDKILRKIYEAEGNDIW